MMKDKHSFPQIRDKEILHCLIKKGYLINVKIAVMIFYLVMPKFLIFCSRKLELEQGNESAFIITDVIICDLKRNISGSL